ncbi:MAG: IS3 family transposase [Burkholderiales bacterium]
MKYAFIRSQRSALGVSLLCRALRVSQSGYYDWSTRPESRRSLRDRELLAHIRHVHEASRQAYGAKKTWLELKAQGVACGKHRVARLRQRAGIEAKRKRRFRLTVEHHHSAAAAPNLIRRQFGRSAPNRAWVGDMTFIRTREGFLHLAVLLDLYSRRVVGWSMGAQPNLALAMDTLSMAVQQRSPQSGLIHHTDQGPLYSARAYRQQLTAHGMCPSMSGKGNAYDNAVAESFFSTLKNELVHHRDFANRDEARAAIFDYIECFYNRQRLHQTLDCVSPAQFEQMKGVC